MKTSAETWQHFDSLTLEEKKALFKAAQEKLHRGGSPSDEEARAFGELWPILERKIGEAKVAGALQSLMEELKLG